jgi:hypothetical protein
MKTRRKPDVPWNTPMSDADYIARFKSRCVITESGCWEWQGWTCRFRGIKPGQRGYPQASVRNKSVRLHRWMLETMQRPLVKGEVACHKCDNKPCINPDHLFIGTQKDNIRDGMSRGKQQFHPSHYTKCKSGHEFTPENTWICKNGWRHCKACGRIRLRVASGWPRDEAAAMAMTPIPQGAKTARRQFKFRKAA